MNWVKATIFGFITAGLLMSCQQNGSGPEKSELTLLPPAPGNLDARGFEIRNLQNGYEVLIFDPWNRLDTFASHLITFEEQGYERWAVFSTTHIGFLDALDESKRVVGSTSPDRIYNQDLRRAYDEGKIIRIGTDMEYNIESLHQLHPDILVQSAFPGQKGKDARIVESGINMFYMMEWLEPTALGRAEWIKVFGLLLGKENHADSIYGNIRNEYLKLCQTVKNVKDKPSVIIGNSFKGTWYMPGGNSYQTGLLADAGFEYSYSNTRERASLALGFEVVMHDFKNAECWINVSAKNLNQLIQEDARYSLFDAYQSGSVYTFDKRLRNSIANDYWESGVVNPHLVLKDLIKVANPNLLPDYQMYYYRKLN